MTTRQIPVARTAMGVIAIGVLLVQFIAIPRAAAELANRYPEVAYLEWPYVISTAVAIGGFEVALFAAWQVLSIAKSGGVLTNQKRRWVRVIKWSLVFMAVVFAGVCAHASFIANVGGPAAFFGLLISLALVPCAVALGRAAMGFTLEDVDDLAAAGSQSS